MTYEEACERAASNGLEFYWAAKRYVIQRERELSIGFFSPAAPTDEALEVALCVSTSEGKVFEAADKYRHAIEVRTALAH